MSAIVPQSGRRVVLFERAHWAFASARAVVVVSAFLVGYARPSHVSLESSGPFGVWRWALWGQLDRGRGDGAALLNFFREKCDEILLRGRTWHVKDGLLFVVFGGVALVCDRDGESFSVLLWRYGRVSEEYCCVGRLVD